MATERDVYRDLSVLRDSRLGEDFSRSISEYSKNICPRDFYFRLLIRMIFPIKHTLDFLFGEEGWMHEAKDLDLEEFMNKVDELLYEHLSVLKLLDVIYDRETGYEYESNDQDENYWQIIEEMETNYNSFIKKLFKLVYGGIFFTGLTIRNTKYTINALIFQYLDYIRAIEE